MCKRVHGIIVLRMIVHILERIVGFFILIILVQAQFHQRLAFRFRNFNIFPAIGATKVKRRKAKERNYPKKLVAHKGFG